MAVFRPELHRIEDVIDYYENSPATHYKIYAGTSPKSDYCRFSFEEDEKEIGLQKLAEALRAVQQNVDNTNPYILQLIEKKKNPKSKENDNLTSIVFQLNKPERYLPMLAGMQQQQQPNENFNRLIEKMIEGQNLIISKLSAEEYEEEQEKPNALGAILNNPEAINAIIGYACNFLDRIIPPKNNAANLSTISGVPDEQREKALQAIEILSTKDSQFGDHLLYLANIDQATYKMLLGFMK